MAEGDTILRLARRLSDAFAGTEVRVATPGPRRPDGMPASALEGRAIESVESRGKHLLLHFSGGLALHSHLGMRGSWHLYRRGERWRRPRRSAWLALSAGGIEAVNFGGSSLRVVRDGELRRDPRLARLGPDILSDQHDAAAVAARLRADRGAELGVALLDQALVAGIGNIFKSEGCFAASVSPWRAVAELEDDDIVEILSRTRSLMLDAVESGRQPDAVYGKAGRPCPRCGTAIRSRRQGDDARLSYWCPACQPASSQGSRGRGAPISAEAR